MSEDREQRVRELAHSLWQADGEPEGQEHDFWFRAEQMVAAENGHATPDLAHEAPL